MRSVIYRFPDLEQLEDVLSRAGWEDGPAAHGAETELELGVPAGESLTDGEWVLAIFELGAGRRATSAAARAAVSPEGARLTFEPRDWRRITVFAQTEARRLGSMSDVDAAPKQDGHHAASREPRWGFSGAQGQSSSGAAAQADEGSGARRSPNAAAPPGEGGPARITRIAAPPPPGISASLVGPRSHGKGARVLVVDDDPDIRALVATMLEAVELIVTSLSSAEEALQRLRVEPFDLLVLDWSLPRMNGIELCRLLRREPELSDIPVLFLTANASSQDMIEAFASGADDYVVKPFRAHELGARIFSLLRRVRRNAP